MLCGTAPVDLRSVARSAARLGHGVASEAGVSVRQDKLHAMLVGVQVLLGQVIVLVQLARDDQGLAFVHALDGLLIAGNNVQHIVSMHKVGRADLVALRDRLGGRAIEIAIIFLFGIVVCVIFIDDCVRASSAHRSEQELLLQNSIRTAYD